MNTMPYQIAKNGLCVEQSIQAKKTSAPKYMPFARKSAGGGWIPFAKGQYGGKCFHVMMLS